MKTSSTLQLLLFLTLITAVSQDTPAPRMNKSNKKGKGSGKADSKLTFTPEGGFASTSTAAPGDKAECKQN